MKKWDLVAIARDVAEREGFRERRQLAEQGIDASVAVFELRDTPASTMSASSQSSHATPSSWAMVKWIASTRAK